MQDTILVVEDEADVAELLRFNLSRAGFGVLLAGDGLRGLERARNERPDAVVLDLRLPEMDGYALCKALRNDSDTKELPIVILTARAEPEERIHGLEIGADDYMTKPFSPRELVLRVQAVLRRSRPSIRKPILEVGDFQLDKSNFHIWLEGRRLELTATEFKLLSTLIERRGQTQSRGILLNDVLGYQNSMDTRTVDTHVRRLREKLGRHASWLQTVRGEGYRFNAVLLP